MKGENIMTVRKTFELEDLDCAGCALKMENAIKEISGVSFAAVSYLAQKMTIEAEQDSFDGIMKQVVKICKKIEPDCGIKL